MKNKVIIITGASSGIGEACARTCAKRGAIVVLAARNISRLEQLAGELKKEGKQVLAVQTDVSREEDCRNLIHTTIDNFGRIDVLINNAGISMRALFNDLHLDVFRRVMDVNFWGAVYCTKYALPSLLKSKGSVVGITSVAGRVPLPARSGYCASKFALEGFLRTLRMENNKNGLHVLIACPGFTSSNIRALALDANAQPQGESPLNEKELMTPDQVAEQILNAVEARKRDLIFDFVKGKLLIFLYKLFPLKIDEIVYRSFAKEPDSPIR